MFRLCSYFPLNNFDAIHVYGSLEAYFPNHLFSSPNCTAEWFLLNYLCCASITINQSENIFITPVKALMPTSVCPPPQTLPKYIFKEVWFFLVSDFLKPAASNYSPRVCWQWSDNLTLLHEWPCSHCGRKTQNEMAQTWGNKTLCPVTLHAPLFELLSFVCLDTKKSSDPFSAILSVLLVSRIMVLL